MKIPTAFFFLTSLLLPLSSFVHAWGKDGHELVGNLAYRLLSDATQKVVVEILQNHPFARRTSTTTATNTPLGDVADWADQVRISHDYHWSGPLHYIDIHDEQVQGGCPVYDPTKEQQDLCHFDYERDCAEDFCVAGAIVNYTNHLQQQLRQQQQQQHWKRQQHFYDRNLRGSAALVAPWYFVWPWSPPVPTNSRPAHAPLHDNNNHRDDNHKLVQESLMFLTHFIGDIHQPLHSGRNSDRGGNTIEVTFEVPSHYSTTRYSSSRRPRDGRRSLPQYYYSSHHHQELHAVWDTSMIERAIHTIYNHDRDSLEQELLDYIDKAKTSGEVDHKWLACSDTRQSDCPSQWAEESWQHALHWAYNNTDGKEVIPKTHLTDEYYETRWPQIKHYLAVAGVRLAAALELVLGDGIVDTTAAPPSKQQQQHWWWWPWTTPPIEQQTH